MFEQPTSRMLKRAAIAAAVILLIVFSGQT
jgi:hypothetical protein